jgi:hypothetical protein
MAVNVQLGQKSESTRAANDKTASFLVLRRANALAP